MDKGVQPWHPVHNTMRDIVSEVTKREYNNEHAKSVCPIQRVHVPDDSRAVAHHFHIEKSNERKHNQAVEPDVAVIRKTKRFASCTIMGKVIVSEKSQSPRAASN